MPNNNSSISKLDKINQQIEALKDKARREKQKLKTKERADDTKRKILVGAMYLGRAENANTMDKLRSELDSYLVRDADRALFDLPPKQEGEKLKGNFQQQRQGRA